MTSATKTHPKTYDEALEVIERLSTDLKLVREQLQALLRQRFGPSADRFVDPNQLLLFGATKAPSAADTTKKPEKKASSTTGQRNGRSEIPPHLERFREELDPDEDERICPICGKPMIKIGEDITEELDYQRPKLRVKQIVRSKWACREDAQGVVTAPLPPRLIDKGRPGVSLLVFVIVAKYVDHMPLHRIERQLARSGMRIHRSTLCDWIGAVASEVERIVELMRYQLTRGRYLQADETPVKARDPNVKHKMRQVYLFAYGVPWGEVVFQYRKSRSGKGPLEFLEGFEGKVQVDEYSGYDALFTEGSGRTRVGCWAHCRRKFVEAEKSEPSRVQAVLRVVRKGYRLDSLMREKGYSHEDRLRVRDRIYRPAADNLRQRLIDEVHDSSILPRSKYGKALRYLVNHWENLEQPFLDGELELDNNGIESAIRPVAIGRKNWMHIGDVDAGDRAAIFYSLLVSCTRLGINPEEYLTDVLTRLPSCPASEIMELTPTEWKKARQLEQDAPAEETSSA